jgi:hypothetical protein
MKKILSSFLFYTYYLSAVAIPVEENLSISSMDNGIEVWLKTNAIPSQTISCRVIAKNPLEAVPQVFSLDCPLDAFEEELPYFVDLCKESIPNEAQCKMAVVAVGDFEEKSLGEFLEAAFEVFSYQALPPVSQMISVNQSTESDMVYLSLSYPSSFQEIKTDQDLKKLWVLYLLQSVVEERFRKIIRDVDGQWISVSQTKYLLPYINSVAKGKQMINSEPHSMLLAFLVAMQEIKSSGFSEQELSDAKAKLQKNLLNFYQKNPTSGVLADYLASHCAFGAGHPDYSIFMTMSFKAISEIERSDVAQLIGAYFKDATRRVEMTVPSNLNITKASIQQTLDMIKTDNVVLNLNENIADIGSAQGQTSYNQLSLTDAEAKMIYQIIDSLGNLGLAKLYFKEDEMTMLGNKVQHVHPLKFLETVLTNPHLKQSMVQVEDSYFKWRGFLNGSSNAPGFVARCNREADHNNFAPYIRGFCQVVKAHPEQVRAFIERREWEKLVRFLIKLEN